MLKIRIFFFHLISFIYLQESQINLQLTLKHITFWYTAVFFLPFFVFFIKAAFVAESWTLDLCSCSLRSKHCVRNRGFISFRWRKLIRFWFFAQPRVLYIRGLFKLTLYSCELLKSPENGYYATYENEIEDGQKPSRLKK